MAAPTEARPILVTGGAGFMGTHVVRVLTSQRRGRVVVLDDLSGGFRENVPADAEFVHPRSSAARGNGVWLRLVSCTASTPSCGA